MGFSIFLVNMSNSALIDNLRETEDQERGEQCLTSIGTTTLLPPVKHEIERLLLTNKRG